MAITKGAQFIHYRILTLLGAGGVGEVYPARHELAGAVAIKLGWRTGATGRR